MDWKAEVEKIKQPFLDDMIRFLSIPSVLDEQTKQAGAPFGKDVKQAMDYLLQKAEEDGMTTKDVDGYASHIEYGQGEEIIGILCHVDVVPPGEGWTNPPFSPTIINGKIYARGAIDDKGPTMAAYYALKLVKDANVPLSKRVRMIIGGDEESDWRCVDHYFKQAEMPVMGFAPDADFPIIHAEKGISDVVWTQQITGREQKDYTLQSFSAGARFNMVPDEATAVISGKHVALLFESFSSFLKEYPISGHAELEEETVTLFVKGKSAHAMEPNHGVNAGLYLAHFLHDFSFDRHAHDFLSFIDTYFFQDSRGEKLHIQTKDEISGDLTVNVGVLRFRHEDGGMIGMNMRYPVTTISNTIHETLQKVAAKQHFTYTIKEDSKPHYVKEDHPLIQTLKRVYEKHTGQEGTLLSIGGGTYARALQAGVAFGPLFPGRNEVAHQKDEYVHIDDLLRAIAIYAEAIYELAK